MIKRKKISSLQNQIEILYNQSLRVLAGTAILTWVSGIILQNKVNNSWLLTWVIAMTVWTIGRGILIYSFFKSKGKKRYQIWGWYFAISSGIAGIILGSAIFLTPPGFSFELSYLYIIFVGMIAGSVLSTSSYLPAMYSFYFSLYTIVSIRMIIDAFANTGNSFVNGLTFLFIFTTPILLQFGKSINRWIKQIYDMYIEKEILSRRLEIEEKRLRLSDTVLQNVKEGVIITNSKKNIIFTNPAFSQITGYDHKKVANQDLGAFFYDPQNHYIFENIWKTIEIGGNWHGEIWTQRPNGETYPVMLNIVTLSDNNGEITNYIAHFRDITHQKIEEEKLRYYANYDPLTGLPNRKSINDHLDEALSKSSMEIERGALLFLDLNYFKDINDQFGHRIGDTLLQEVALRLKETLRDIDMVGRLGGDEFVVVLWNIDRDTVKVVAEKLVTAIQRPFIIQDKECGLSLSIGIAYIPDHGAERRSLMYRADMAMYEAKRFKETGRWVVYEESFIANFNQK